jgi:phosphoenolpyruvate carboxylase
MLARVRSDKLSFEEKTILEDALIVSINGIAQGMRNSG